MDRFAGTSAKENARRAVAAARGAFGGDWTPDRVAIAPGRIELLGNHVDYNGGPVLAAAIDRFIAVAAREEAVPPSTVRAVAADSQSGQLTSIDAATLGNWRNASPPPLSSDYLRGLLAAVTQRNEAGASLTLLLPSSVAIAGDVPIGFGVSSSAALCVALALALVDGLASSEELVLLAQEAEHRAGTPCGTMDQSASVSGGVIAFNGADLSVERLSPSLGDLVFAVVDSGVERSLSTSSYPIRVVESQTALDLAQLGLGIELSYLAAVSKEQLVELEQRNLMPETLLGRVRHVVEETERVREGRRAISSSDWVQFGHLMTASGQSSATLYEISHPDVEQLVAEARQIDGVLGARMMGGGEGGSALILTEKSAINGLESSLRRGYFRRRGMEKRDGLIHVCSFAPGATMFTASELGAIA